MNTSANLPFSTAAERNKEAIGDALAYYLQVADTVLEIGSGSGQHAVYLCDRFDHLTWQMSEKNAHVQALSQVVAHTGSDQLPDPVVLEVGSAAKAISADSSDSGSLDGGLSGAGSSIEGTNATGLPFKESAYSLVFSANTAHIMDIEEVAFMFEVVSYALQPKGFFALYGPFKINGEHTSDSNRNFDTTLRRHQPYRGIRDKDELDAMASDNGMRFEAEIIMPANNRTLLWRTAEF